MTTYGYDAAPLETLIRCGIKVILNNDMNVDDKYVPMLEVSPDLVVLCTDKNKPGLKYHGCSHSKLWLLRFADKLRVVVGSANMTEDDFMNWS